MTTSRDEESRASAYITSNKPLFHARNIDRKFFTRSRVSRDEPVVSPQDSPSSRIPVPRKTSSPRTTTSLRDAYEKAVREEEEDLVPGNRHERNAEAGGSPSPAPRPRPTGRNQMERDEQRMRRLREGMQVITSSPLGHNGENDIVSPLEDDDTRSNRSGASGVSPEEESPDEWLKEMKRAADDQRRVAAALNSQNRLFTRGGLGARVTETAQSLVRKSSASSLESEPGVRIPRTWGRHARKNPGWLNRISSPETSEEVYGLPQQIVSEGSIDWAGAAVDAPLQSVENGSPVQEPTPPHSRPNSAQPQNTSTQKSHIWDPEFDFTAQSVQESTSPQLKIRNTKLDEIRAREIQALSKRAVATARLEEIKERNSAERSVSPDPTTLIARNVVERHKSEDADRWVRQRFHSASDAEDSSKLEALAEIAATAALPEKEDIQDTDTKVVDQPQPLATMKGREISPEVVVSSKREADVKVPFATESALQDYAHEKTILEEEGEAIPGTPITIFKGAATKGKKSSQMGHSRDDSWENLRKLARLTSTTPSPATGKLAEKPSDESLKYLNRLSADIKRLSGTSTPPKSDIDPEERIVSEVSLFELQDDKPERNSLRTPSPADDDGVDETPRPKPDPLSLPTPVVTGAYIDTPAPRGRQPKISRPSSPPLVTGDVLHDEVSRLCIKDFMRASSSHSNTSRKDGRAVQRGAENSASHLSSSSAVQSPKPRPGRHSRPPLINSSNPASAEDDLRAIQQEAEDSTLDDFDGLILAEAEDLDLDPATKVEALVDLEKDDHGQPLSAEERERRQEMLAIDRMNKTIKSGLVSIRDAKRGIERLEDQVSSTSLEHNHDQHTCPKCAAAETSHPALHQHHQPNQYINLPLPRLWSWSPSPSTSPTSPLPGRLRLTRLGLLLALLALWYVAESVACDRICHPVYASTNDWSPRDPFWGGALPALADRVTGGALGVVGKMLWQVVAAFVAGAGAGIGMGEWDRGGVGMGMAGAGGAGYEDAGDELWGFAADEVL